LGDGTKQEDCEFETSLNCIARPCLKIKKEGKKEREKEGNPFSIVPFCDIPLITQNFFQSIFLHMDNLESASLVLLPLLSGEEVKCASPFWFPFSFLAQRHATDASSFLFHKNRGKDFPW
jgi:hypothetical protein